MASSRWLINFSVEKKKIFWMSPKSMTFLPEKLER